MILVTGATGFVGNALVRRLAENGAKTPVIAATRDARAIDLPGGVERIAVGELSAHTDWSACLSGRRTVIHCAARVHVMRDTAADPLEEFRRVNVAGTLHLARQAAGAGVKRFVFVSSVKVNGEATEPGHPFKADDPAQAKDPYGISKLEAEAGLRQLAAEGGMEVVIVRPPLVYGPGVKANFAAMMKVVTKGLPLPLGAVTENRRSLVALDNLVDLLVTCAEHPAAGNQTFLASDGEDLSTAELLRRMGQALGVPARLLPVPTGWLNFGAGILGKRDIAQRLLGSLQLDISKTRELLNWTPPKSVDEGLRLASTLHRQ